MPMWVFKQGISTNQLCLSSGWIFLYQFYIEPYVAFDGWNYLNNDDLLNEVSSPITPTILKRINRKYGFTLVFR